VPVGYDLATDEVLFSRRRRAVHLVTWPAIHRAIEQLLPL
jgi:hypothetical protein